MTAGPVAAQPTIPSKANIERVRDPDARSDAKEQSGEAEDGFDGLLSKMTEDVDRSPGESDVPKGGARPENRKDIRWRDIEARLAAREGGGDLDPAAAGDCAACSVPDLDGEPHVEGTGERQLTSQAETPTPGLGGARADQIVAIAAGNSVNAPADVETETPEPAARASQATVPAKAGVAGQSAEGDGAVQPAPLAAGDVARGPAAATASALAGAAAPEGTNGKDKPAQAGRSRIDDNAADIGRTGSGRAAAKPEWREFAAVNETTKASVVRQETHFAPVAASTAGAHAGSSAAKGAKSGAGPAALPGDTGAAPSIDGALLSSEVPSSTGASPAQQIADRIIGEAASAQEPASRPAVPLEQTAMKPTLKVLQIQLQPAELGNVSVRIELKDRGLTLHVAADRPETADLIRADQDGLSKLLRSAGYTVDAGSIRVVESGDRTSAAQQGGQQGAHSNPQSSPQSHSGGSERQEHAQRGNSGQNGSETRSQSSRNDTNETTTTRAGNGLYI